ncbi:hypothetical protein Tco_0215688 [Tanacetum coccineum]
MGKLQPKVDIGIFVDYSLAKKAYRIYNRQTRLSIEPIHIDFDELTAMASEQFSSGPMLNIMTPGTISLGLTQNPSFPTPYVPLTKNEWAILFQPMFDEYFNPPERKYVMQCSKVMRGRKVLDAGSDVLKGGIMVVEVVVKWIGGGEVVEVDRCRKWGQAYSCSWDYFLPLDAKRNMVIRMIQKELELGDEIIRECMRMSDPNMLKEASEKHSIRQCHVGTLSNTYHPFTNVVGKIKGFSNDEAVDHVAETSIGMILVSHEAYNVFTKDDFPFLEIYL